MTTKVDAIVIGTGQAGPALAARLNRENMKTAIIERKLIGGTCVNVGCIPTKTLVASAKVAFTARRAAEFGVLVDGSINVDMAQVKHRKDAVAGASNKGVADWIEGMKNVTLIQGHASFVGPNQVRVNDENLEAEKIFIDVGARARIPDIEGLGDVDYLTNSSMMDNDFLPEHLIIIGGSYIGLEFAQMYRRFGAQVTVIEMRERLISREDDDVSKVVHESLAAEGVNVRLNAKCLSVRKTNDGISVGISCDEDPREIEGTHLLLAVGRTPNTHDLGLNQAGIKTDRRGHIEVDDYLRTNVPCVWAMGEVNGRGAFTHTSYNDYEIVAANLFDDDPRSVTDRILCYGLFVDPPLGRVGMTEREAKASGLNVLVGKRMMTRVGRAREFGETRGFIKILVNADNEEILGAAIIGLTGDEAIHCIIDVMYAKQPYTVISRAVHIHPTVSELIPTVLQDLRPLS